MAHHPVSAGTRADRHLYRSYYEEVLIVRVHPEILQAQGIPDALLNEKTIWQERYRSIVDMRHEGAGQWGSQFV